MTPGGLAIITVFALYQLALVWVFVDAIRKQDKNKKEPIA